MDSVAGCELCDGPGMGRGSHFEPESKDNREEFKDECGDEACDNRVFEEPVHVEVLVYEVVGLHRA